MNKMRFIKLIYVAAVFLFTLPAFAENYAGYGYEPTEDEHLGEKQEGSMMNKSLIGKKLLAS